MPAAAVITGAVIMRFLQRAVLKRRDLRVRFLLVGAAAPLGMTALLLLDPLARAGLSPPLSLSLSLVLVGAGIHVALRGLCHTTLGEATVMLGLYLGTMAILPLTAMVITALLWTVGV